MMTQTMTKATRNAIVTWAMERAPSLQLYTLADDFAPADDWGGEAPSDNGGVFHLIAQTDAANLYGETTENVREASYLVNSAGTPVRGTLIEAVESLLNIVFGSQETWPDTYAQTHGWRI